ncbi:MAG TPA: hypothetical protein VFS16_16735, partial [Acidimicrobiia bacterium]|nr:hypothetical protein [Acidimicrobiia bacterium]
MIGLSRAGYLALATALTTGALTTGALTAGARAAVGDAPRPGPEPADVVGAWTDPFGEDAAPSGAVRAAVLGDGRVLYLAGTGSGLLDLRSGRPQFVPTAAAHPDADQWAPSLTALADGRILLVGGTASQLFDPATGSFSPPASLRNGRSYPQVAVGADGGPTVFGGAAPPGRVRRTETYHP